jgi:tetratricopeptide (TPR) repeat protein
VTSLEHERRMSDYVQSASYERALKDKELIRAVIHLRHSRNKANKKAWVSHSRECDRLGATRLSVRRNASLRSNRRVVFVGPELAGHGSAVPRVVISLARELASLGWVVDLVTRLLPENLPLELIELGGNVSFVKPLHDYRRAIDKGSEPVITFWLPLSISLSEAGIRHMCVWDAGGSRLSDGDPVSGLDAALMTHLAPLPDIVLGSSRLPSSGRRVFPIDAVTLANLVEAAYPPFPRFLRLPTIAACMIAKDEEGTIEGCLESVVPCVDQVVINDTGSTDLTPEIAEAYGAEVIRTEWQDDFAAARNISLEMATCDHILVIDADERVAEGSASLIREAVMSGHSGHVVTVANEMGSSVKSISVLRLFRNSPEHRFTGAVHEQIGPSLGGDITSTSIVFDHLGYGRAVTAVKSKRDRNVALLLKAQQELKSEDDPNQYYLAYQAAVELLLAGNAVDALALLSEVIEKVNTAAAFKPAAALRLCQTLLVMGRVKDAYEFALSVLGEYPGFLDIAETAAAALIERKEYELAIELLNEAARGVPMPFLPMTEGADTFILSTLRSRISLGLGDTDKAFEWIERALEENPDYGEAQRFLVVNWPDRAEGSLKKAGVRSVVPAVRALLSLNEPDLATRLAEAANDHGALGEICLARKNFVDACGNFERSSDPWDRDRAAILRQIGILRDLTGEETPGVTGSSMSPAARKAVSGEPVTAGEVDTALKVLGFLLDIGQVELFTSALGCLDRFDTKEVLAGRLLYERGLLGLAREYLERRRVNPPECLSMLGDISYRDKRHADAAGYYKQLSEIRHLNATEAFRLADCLVRAGDLKTVAQVVSEARTFYPDDRALMELEQVLKASPLFGACFQRSP